MCREFDMSGTPITGSLSCGGGEHGGKPQKPHQGIQNIRERLLHAIKIPAASTIPTALDRTVWSALRRQGRSDNSPTLGETKTSMIQSISPRDNGWDEEKRFDTSVLIQRRIPQYIGPILRKLKTPASQQPPQPG